MKRNAPMSRDDFGGRNRPLLWGQIALITLCAYALAALVWYFPYPSPLIKPLLPPKQRWPAMEVRDWVEEGQFDRDFARYFARDPERQVPAAATFVSPADGILQTVDYKDGVTSIVVALSFWDVHVVRTPLAATVKSIDMEGSYLERLAPKAKFREMLFLRGKAAPVEAVITLGTMRGDIKIRMITSYWASRLKIWVYPGEKLAKGQRVGRIMLGSTVIAEIPGKLRLDAPLGEHVSGGATALSFH
jgi:phosphatidylserine decarboxylase